MGHPCQGGSLWWRRCVQHDGVRLPVSLAVYGVRAVVLVGPVGAVLLPVVLQVVAPVGCNGTTQPRKPMGVNVTPEPPLVAGRLGGVVLTRLGWRELQDPAVWLVVLCAPGHATLIVDQ